MNRRGPLFKNGLITIRQIAIAATIGRRHVDKQISKVLFAKR